MIFARSTDGVAWQENRLTAGFDLATAPFARGFFIGDYHALISANNVFIPVYVRTNSGDLSNRTDVFAVPMRSLPLTASAASQVRPMATASIPAFEPDAQLRRRVHENFVRMLEHRTPGWAKRP